jgi:hypothetical protein
MPSASTTASHAMAVLDLTANHAMTMLLESFRHCRQSRHGRFFWTLPPVMQCQFSNLGFKLHKFKEPEESIHS